MESYICVTCGTEYPPSAQPPARCPICEDDRQYIAPNGQQWTTLAELRATHTNSFTDVGPGVTGIVTEPAFAIGQQAHLISTPNGNVLWDCLSLLDEATVAEIELRGGITAIAISHPHFYSSMTEWARTFRAPIYLHADNARWVQYPNEMLRYWADETAALIPDMTVVRCGGHFPGSTVLHWAESESGEGALFTGDTIQVVSDRRWVSFMYSYPNLIPVSAAVVQHIVAEVEPYQFARIYGGWRGRVVYPDAKGAVRRSADRYIGHLRDERWP